MTKSHIQQGILDAVPAHANYLTFSLLAGADCRKALLQLAPLIDGKRVVLGVGLGTAHALDRQIAQLRDFPVIAGAKVELPVNKAALWCWLREAERGVLVAQVQRVIAALSGAFELTSCVDAFRFDMGRDLTGYEDGTENPQDQAAIDTAIVHQTGAGLDGGSFVAVQQWQHQWHNFRAMSRERQDNAVGRRMDDNEELENAPESAHVKRTAQENFEPEAFVVRRSMPWSCGTQSGLYFAAFGHSFDAFEAQLTRMAGAEDGIVDALFGFSQPLTGSYFWCPPMQDGKVDLSALLN